jgi:hypothetical protein
MTYAEAGCSAAVSSRTVNLRDRQRVSLLFCATHVGSLWHVVVSLADTASVHHSVPRLA